MNTDDLTDDITDDTDLYQNRLHSEIESVDMNELNTLGNQAIQLGLIAGHGYRGGQYEILRQGQFILLSPTEASTYLQELIADANV